MSINSGIQKTVQWLNDNGFPTCDSGDGKTRDFECDREGAYVVIQLINPASLTYEADRLMWLLQSKGIFLNPISMDNTPCIQASYDPANRQAFIDLMFVDDAMLFP